MLTRLLSLLPGTWHSGKRLTIVTGTSWSFLGQGGSQALRLISTLILAKLLLSPEAFGLVALVNVYIACFEMLTDVGLGPNIVQHALGGQARFLQTAFTIQLLRGGMLWLAATSIAYPYAWFFDEPQLGPLIIVASLAPLFRSASNIGIHVLTRHVAIRPMALLTLSSEVTGCVVAIIWAYLAPSPWALVVGAVTSAAAYSIGSHIVITGHKTLGWDSTSAKEIARFGGWVFVSTATYFFASQGERLFLGKTVTAAELGCFAISASIAMVPLQFALRFSSLVALPVLSDSLRTSRTLGLRHYARIRNVLFAVSGVLALLFVFLSDPLVTYFLHDTYKDIVWILPLLGIRYSFSLLGALSSSLILSMGQSRYAALQNVVTLVLMLAGLHAAFTLTSNSLLWAMILLALLPSVSNVVFLRAIQNLAPELLKAELVIFVTRLIFGSGLITLTILLYKEIIGL